MIKIIDYKAGNAPSVFHAVDHLGHKAEFAKSPECLKGATHIILPGVGSASATMDSLKEMDLIPALEEAVLDKKIPFLGICIGLQILFDYSEEDSTKCLGWLPGKVVKFDQNKKDGKKIPVPQMGWNKVCFVKDTKVSAREDYFYFVNSYHAQADIGDIWGQSTYNGTFVGAVNRGNIYATQFHVEKSGEAGLVMMDDFIKITDMSSHSA